MITMRTFVPSSTWFLMLCTLLPGATPSSLHAARPPAAGSSRQSPAPPPAPTDAELRSYVERLPPGSRVKVRLKSGESFKAILMRASGDEVLVKPRTRRPVPERRLALTDIDFVEPDIGSSTAKVVGISIAAAAGTVITLFLLIAKIYSD